MRLSEQIFLLFVLLRLAPLEAFDGNQYCDADLLRRWAETMEEVYRLLAPRKAAYINGIVPMCFEICCLLGPVTFEGQQGDLRVVGEWDGGVEPNGRSDV